MLNVCRTSAPSILTLYTFGKLPPADDRLTRPQPDAGCDAHQHGTHIFHHVYMEYGLLIVGINTIAGMMSHHWTWYGKGFAHISIPLYHPIIEIVILIE